MKTNSSVNGGAVCVPTTNYYCSNRRLRKPHVNVGTIGHVDHGKTTLTAKSQRC